MELQNSRLLPVSQDMAWMALNDPGVLRQCIPGCESLDRIDDRTWSVAMVAAVGPFKARFTGKLWLSDIIAPTSYTLHFDGQSGNVGAGRGKVTVTLLTQGPVQTTLAYDAKAQLTGELTHLGAPLLESAARKLADDFFTRFTAVVSPNGVGGSAEPVAADGEVAAALAADAVARNMPGPQTGLMRWWPWALAAVIAGLIVLWAKHVG